MGEITYRPGVSADISAITDIARRIWTMGLSSRLEEHFGQLGDRPWDELVAEDIGGSVATSIEAGQCIVAEADGRVAGWVTWSVQRARDRGQVGYNGVDPAFRGKGIGTRLVEMALKQIKESGVRIALVMTGLDPGHAPARRVYEKCGFVPFHESITYVKELKDEAN